MQQGDVLDGLGRRLGLHEAFPREDLVEEIVHVLCDSFRKVRLEALRCALCSLLQAVRQQLPLDPGWQRFHRRFACVCGGMVGRLFGGLVFLGGGTILL